MENCLTDLLWRNSIKDRPWKRLLRNGIDVTEHMFPIEDYKLGTVLK